MQYMCISTHCVEFNKSHRKKHNRKAERSERAKLISMILMLLFVCFQASAFTVNILSMLGNGLDFAAFRSSDAVNSVNHAKGEAFKSFQRFS